MVNLPKVLKLYPNFLIFLQLFLKKRNYEKEKKKKSLNQTKRKDEELFFVRFCNLVFSFIVASKKGSLNSLTHPLLFWCYCLLFI